MLISIQVAKDPLRFSRHTPKVYHSDNWLASQLPLSIQELLLDPNAFRPPQKKERMRYNKCNNFPSVNQTNGIYCYTEKSSIKRKGRCPNFRFPQSRKSDGPLNPFNKYDTSKTSSGTPRHRHSNTPECPRPEDCHQTLSTRNQYRTLC